MSNEQKRRKWWVALMSLGCVAVGLSPAALADERLVLRIMAEHQALPVIAVVCAVLIAIGGALRARGRRVPLNALLVLPIAPLALSVLPSKSLPPDLVAEIGADVVAQVSLGETVVLARAALLVACGLLAAIASVLATERLGSSRIGVIALFGVPSVWLAASMFGYIVGMLSQRYGSPEVGAKTAFFLVALAAGFAALRIRERGPAAHGAFIIPVIGLVMALLMAFAAALDTDDALATALLVGTQSRGLLDQHLLEATQNFTAVAWIAVGPLLALVATAFIRLLFARRVPVEPAYRGLVAGLLLLATAVLLGGMPHAHFAESMQDNASAWTTEDLYSQR